MLSNRRRFSQKAKFIRWKSSKVSHRWRERQISAEKIKEVENFRVKQAFIGFSAVHSKLEVKKYANTKNISLPRESHRHISFLITRCNQNLEKWQSLSIWILWFCCNFSASPTSCWIECPLFKFLQIHRLNYKEKSSRLQRRTRE